MSGTRNFDFFPLYQAASLLDSCWSLNHPFTTLLKCHVALKQSLITSSRSNLNSLNSLSLITHYLTLICIYIRNIPTNVCTFGPVRVCVHVCTHTALILTYCVLENKRYLHLSFLRIGTISFFSTFPTMLHKHHRYRTQIRSCVIIMDAIVTLSMNSAIKCGVIVLYWTCYRL